MADELSLSTIAKQYQDTDSFSGCRKVGEDFAVHETVNHIAGE